MSTLHNECFNSMINYIETHSEVAETPASLTVHPLTIEHLIKTSKQIALYGILTQPKGRLLDADYKAWANALEAIGWLPRRSIYSSASLPIKLAVLLKRSHEHWKGEQLKRSVKPTPKNPPKLDKPKQEDKSKREMTHNAKACLEHMKAYLEKYTKPLAFKNQQHIPPVLIDSLYAASHSIDIYGLGDFRYKMSDGHYQDWAAVLKRTYGWPEREPYLWQCLRSARLDWRQYCRIGTSMVYSASTGKAKSATINQSTIVARNTPVKPRIGANIMYSTFSDIKVEDVSKELLDKNEIISKQCEFCGKEMVVHFRVGQYLRKLTKGSNFYCQFCVRHDIHTRKQHHVFLFTLRALIGYLHSACYFGKTPRLYMSEIDDMIAEHVAIGHQNPLFLYDPETYCWFVDFNKVGSGDRQLPVSEVIRTVNEMVSAFNPYNNIREFKGSKYVDRFRESIMTFYEQRFRPPGKRLCAPTLSGCASEIREGGTGVNANKKLDLSSYRDFLPADFKLSPRR